MYGLLGLLPTSGENVIVNSIFRDIFSEKNGDVFNNYFTRCVYIYIYIYTVYTLTRHFIR